jgi:pantoate--beta-alanine ligase
MSEALRAERLATTAYVSAADGETLAELDRLRDGAPALLSLAVRFGATRLIDNEPLP